MNTVKLPNGFALDLDSVHYITSIMEVSGFERKHYKWNMYIECENAKVLLHIKDDAQMEGIRNIILTHLLDRAKKVKITKIK